jgi:WD40 repeat protein
VWDTQAWKIIFEPQYGNEMVNELFRDLTWSPDGRSLAFSTEVGGVQVVDTLNGQVISRQKEFASTVKDLAWSPDGSRLLATGDLAYGMRRWRLSDDQSVRLFDPRLSNSMVVAWSPDGERIASGHVQGAVCFWTTSTNRCDGFIQAHRSATFSLAWSPGGNQIATGGGVIRIWDTHTGRLIKAFGEETEYVYDRIEWPVLGGPLVTLESKLDDRRDTVLRLWDVATGSILAEFRGQQQNEAAPVNGSHPIR